MSTKQLLVISLIVLAAFFAGGHLGGVLGERKGATATAREFRESIHAMNEYARYLVAEHQEEYLQDIMGEPGSRSYLSADRRCLSVALYHATSLNLQEFGYGGSQPEGSFIDEAHPLFSSKEESPRNFLNNGYFVLRPDGSLVFSSTGKRLKTHLE